MTTRIYLIWDKQELDIEAFNEYLDRCIMEALLIHSTDEYSEKDERAIHLKELGANKKRVCVDWQICSHIL